MSTMNISLPEELKAFVDQQVGSRGYSSSSEYVRELIRREQDREQLRALILDGAASPLSAVVADKAHFHGLPPPARGRARGWAGAAQAAEAGVGRPARAGKKAAGR